VLDGLGGPSIYYFTSNDLLAGIDYIPKNETWRHSSLNKKKIKVHSQSQIASVTWLNGTSSWVYYQDLESQLREIGMDDYRDQSWRDGSVGPLAKTQPGTGIGVVRWLNGRDEVEELYFQVLDGGIQGRMYAENRWITEFYSIDGTPGNVPAGASISATTIRETGNATSMIYIAYLGKRGFVNGQSRGTTNITKFSGFSSPIQLADGNGHSRTGLGCVGGESGDVKVYFVRDQKIVELLNNNVTSSNWTKNELS